MVFFTSQKSPKNVYAGGLSKIYIHLCNPFLLLHCTYVSPFYQVTNKPCVVCSSSYNPSPILVYLPYIYKGGSMTAESDYTGFLPWQCMFLHRSCRHKTAVERIMWMDVLLHLYLHMNYI